MTDLIDRNALRRDIDEMCRLTGFDTPMTAIYCVKRVIERQPTIDPESLRPVGRWTEMSTEAFIGVSDSGEPKFADRKYFVHRDCGRKSAIKETYCPYCGAKMVDASDGGAGR